MGLNWLRKAGAGIAKGLNWFGQNVGKPLLGMAKNIPVVGDIVKAADPLLSTVSKTTQWAQDALDGVPAGKRRAAPTLADAGAAFNSAKNTIGQIGRTAAAFA